MEIVDIPLRNPHHDLFICFNSRFSFKLSTKPLRTSPAHGRDTPLSSSSFTSRHLRNNATLKPSGQASPMFPSSSYTKRSCHFETTEPSSPTVTCIGQVRVKKKNKNKKKGRRITIGNNPVSRSGEDSFRAVDSADEGEPLSHIQKQFHLPFLACFFCSHRRKDKDRVQSACGADLRRRSRHGSCAAAISRWVLALHGEEKEEENVTIDAHLRYNKEEGEGCEPPRNALLLMRCRSDPTLYPTAAEMEQSSHLSKDEEQKDDEEEEGVSPPEVRKPNKEEERKVLSEQMEEGGKYSDERAVIDSQHSALTSVCASPIIVDSHADSAGGEEMEVNAGAVVGEENGVVLPDCFLMMMRRETRVSTEVCKETWVCTSDFLQRFPRRRINPVDDDDPRRNKHLMLPPRSSCCLPGSGVAAGMSMTAMIEQRLAAAAAYEPVVLTRCKSEPAGAAHQAGKWRKRVAVVGVGSR